MRANPLDGKCNMGGSSSVDLYELASQKAEQGVPEGCSWSILAPVAGVVTSQWWSWMGFLQRFGRRVAGGLCMWVDVQLGPMDAPW